jgi:hypothetical protein
LTSNQARAFDLRTPFLSELAPLTQKGLPPQPPKKFPKKIFDFVVSPPSQKETCLLTLTGNLDHEPVPREVNYLGRAEAPQYTHNLRPQNETERRSEPQVNCRGMLVLKLFAV